MNELLKEQLKQRRVLIDIEANALVRPTRIWCIVCFDIDTQETFKFKPNIPENGHLDFKEEFLAFAKTVKTWIGHNIISYDVVQLNDLLGMNIKVGECVDTLVMSRLFRPVPVPKDMTMRSKHYARTNGHSLEAWGVWLGYPKQPFSDFSIYTDVMLDYCINDVKVNFLIYKALLHESVGFSDLCIRIEHKTAWLLALQERNGFYLDQDKARKLRDDTEYLLAFMLEELKRVFPPMKKLIRNYTPTITKGGELGKVSQRILDEYTHNPNLAIEKLEDGTYNLYAMQEFNPKSGQQIAERLYSLGWTPKKFTEKGTPKTDKETMIGVFEEFSHIDEVKHLMNFNIVADRNQKAIKWLDLVQEDGRVHGRINPIGAGTHRCSHYDDNMANIARVVPANVNSSVYDDGIRNAVSDILDASDNKEQVRNQRRRSASYSFCDYLPDNSVYLGQSPDGSTFHVALTGLRGKYGWDSRDCWSVEKGNVLVGCDASGIQLRGLAHYMNDTAYTTALLVGDIHEVNRVAAGIDTRNKAKTFIYAWLLGAGDEKIGSIVGVEPHEYEELISWAGDKGVKRIVNKLHKENRKADKRTVCIIIKGARVKKQFLESTPSLKRLREEDIPAASKNGYLLGLDGRKLWIPNEHLAMSLYLQGFEAVIMKTAMCFYSDTLRKEGVWFKQVAFTHDEFQIETKPETAELVGLTVKKAIKDAGLFFNTNCELDGEYKIGMSWAQTH